MLFSCLEKVVDLVWFPFYGIHAIFWFNFFLNWILAMDHGLWTIKLIGYFFFSLVGCQVLVKGSFDDVINIAFCQHVQFQVFNG